MTIQDYVNNEYDRLNEKKILVDNAVSGQKRAIQLNESYRKRVSRYTQIVMIISIVLLIYLGTLMVKKMIPGYPEWIFDVFLAIVFVVGGVYCLMILNEINSRSILNYDELELAPI
jgi:hypothetical protein